MTQSIEIPVSERLDDDLLADFVAIDGGITMLGEQRQRIQQELERRMLEREATEILHPSIECRLEKGTPTWDYGKLAKLRELLPPEVIDTAWSAAHQETVDVPEKWNMVKAKTFAKYGGEIADVIAKATIPGRSRLVVKKREPK